MISTAHLISLCDAYKVAAGVEKDQTASYRIFGDSKKLAAMRNGASITIDRCNAAVMWLHDFWPAGKPIPSAVKELVHPPAHGPASTPAQGPDRKSRKGDAAMQGGR